MPYRVAEATRSIRTRPALAYSIGGGIFATTFAMRAALDGVLDAAPFITFLPAVLIAALVGGLGVGIVVAVLSAAAAFYFFVPPFHSLTLDWPAGYLLMVLFAVTTAIELFVIDALNKAVDRLSHERDRSDVLFRELQHRVANNMAFVASLLRIERRAVGKRVRDADVILAEAEARLEIMARIHRRLYDPSIVTTPLQAYLEALASDVLEATGASGVIAVARVPAVTFGLDRLVALSLLVSEVITNSVKHGFKGRDGGVISIALDRASDQYVLIIADDGHGIDPRNQETGGSLGMTIIRSLATQLGGEISWTNTGVNAGNGTTARLVFKAS